MDEFLSLFEKARENGQMDSETQQKIFSFFSSSWSCIPLRGTSILKVGGKQKDAKISKIYGWSKGCSERLELTDTKTDMIGICCGPYNGILVLDIDDENKFAQYCKENGLEVPETFTDKTHRGFHRFYKYPEDGNTYGTKAFKDLGFDIRGNGGYVVAAGSSHPEGGYYDIVNFNNGQFTDPPQWLLDLCIEPVDTVDEISTDLERVQPAAPNVSNALITLENSLPLEVMDKLKSSPPEKQRSEPIWSVLLALINAKISDSDIKMLFYSNALGERFREKGDKYFDEEIKRAKEYVKHNPPNNPNNKNKSVDITDEADKFVGSLEYFVNEEDKIFCKAVINNQFNYIDISSSIFFGFINEEMKKRYKKRITRFQFKDMLDTLKFHLECDKTLKKIKSIKRFAKHEKTILYNLGGKYPDLIYITPGEVKLSQQSIPLDMKKDLEEAAIDLTSQNLDNFNELLSLFQIEDYIQRHYLIVHCLSLLFEEIDTPILYLHGEAGNGKTTFGTVIRNIFDPQAGRGAPLTNKIDDFITHTSNFDVVFFDNFTNISGTIQDLLSNSYSGAHTKQRKKYSDNDPINIVFKCSIILSSIVFPRLKPDLISRCVFLKINKKENILPNIDLNKRIDILLPKVRGELINFASKVMTIFYGTNPYVLSRHGDFEKLAVAAIEVLSNNPEYQNNFENVLPNILDIEIMLNSRDNLLYGEVIDKFISIIRQEQIKFFTMAEMSNQISSLITGYTGNDSSLSRLIKNKINVLIKNGIYVFEGHKINTGRVYFAYDKNSKSYPFLLDIENLQNDPAAIRKKYLDIVANNQNMNP